MDELVIATRNQGKFDEIRVFLKPRFPRLKVYSLAELKGLPELHEDGSTFLDNARMKATLVSSFARKPALADDSGLEVTGLGGRPGVLSARFAGPEATHEENLRKLLDKMKGASEQDRQARFRCAMVLRAPSGRTVTAVGEVTGVIVDAPKGSGGFGYDPVFFLPYLGRTMAELSIAEKNEISHRALALKKIADLLPDFLADA
ncbi:MAG: XTP/dITP diphosphatase [Pseudomonadota bacterium]